ncbi:MAG TPA: TIGR03086 family metal-binding protein [Streptomyces sp.]|jgi:uncharacterized protein (TIGR03086 family)|nr:TIGR03086 family metal-binding protein [Streptomyces sp.]
MAANTRRPDLAPAARRLTALLDGVRDDQLADPTPCTESSVADLLDHLVGLTVAFHDAATKTAGPGAAGQPRASADHLPPDWRRRLPAQLDALAAAWADPAAWDGTAEAGGVTMPAEVMGIVALDEIVLHAWDLAVATGQDYTCEPAEAEALIGLLSAAADPDAGNGMFGPVVPVPADAPPFHRALGLSGRDPHWHPTVSPAVE